MLLPRKRPAKRRGAAASPNTDRITKCSRTASLSVHTNADKVSIPAFTHYTRSRFATSHPLRISSHPVDTIATAVPVTALTNYTFSPI